jgi:site-specific recombinase XerD
MKRSRAFPELLQSYFGHWLANQRNVSHYTIVSYRDSWRLFLRFIAQKLKLDVAKLDTSDLTAQRVIEFLDDAERTRKVKIATRNCRLAAIKGFFTFLADEDPTWGAHCAAVLRIPMKRGPKRDPCSMDRDETETILGQPDHTNQLGMRDRALLALFYNSGARISEVLAVSPQDLRMESPFQVKLFGKGRKERICPLWPETVELLKVLLGQQKLALDEPIFRNRYGEPLSASGVRFRLRAYLASAARKTPTLAAKRITPHSFRHTAAVHLLESGVDVAIVSNWLGHASLDSTYIYARANLETKRKALKKLELKTPGSKRKAWKQNPSLMTWLDSL